MVTIACSMKHTEECSRICLLLLCLAYMVLSSLQAVKTSTQNVIWSMSLTLRLLQLSCIDPDVSVHYIQVVDKLADDSMSPAWIFLCLFHLHDVLYIFHCLQINKSTKSKGLKHWETPRPLRGPVLHKVQNHNSLTDKWYTLLLTHLHCHYWSSSMISDKRK